MADRNGREYLQYGNQTQRTTEINKILDGLQRRLDGIEKENIFSSRVKLDFGKHGEWTLNDWTLKRGGQYEDGSNSSSDSTDLVLYTPTGHAIIEWRENTSTDPGLATRIWRYGVNNDDEVGGLILRRGVTGGGPGAAGIGNFLNYAGVNDASEEVQMGKVGFRLTDVTDGSEDGEFFLQVTNAGTLGGERLTINHDGDITSTGVSNPTHHFISSDNTAVQLRLRSNDTDNRRIIATGSDAVVDSQINLGESTITLAGNSLSGYSGNERGLAHIWTGDSGTTLAPGTSQDDLVIESSGDAGSTIIAPDANYATYGFGSPSKEYTGGMLINYDDGEMTIGSSVSGMNLRFLSDNSQHAMTLFDTGHLTIAADTGSADTNAAPLHVISNGTVDTHMGRFSLASASSIGQLFYFYRSRGTTASPVALNNDDDLVDMRWFGYNSAGAWKQFGRFEVQTLNTTSGSERAYHRWHSIYNGTTFEFLRHNDGIMSLASPSGLDCNFRMARGSINNNRQLDFDIDSAGNVTITGQNDTGDGTMIIALDPKATDTNADVQFRLFRSTNTGTGRPYFYIYRGNGAATADHAITTGTSGTLVDFCINGGDADFGGSVNVASQLEVTGIINTGSSINAGDLTTPTFVHDASTNRTQSIGGFHTNDDVVVEQYQVKAADETATSDTTFSADSDLVNVTVTANSFYMVEVCCLVDTGASSTPDFKWRFSGPSGCTITQGYSTQNPSVAPATTTGADVVEAITASQTTMLRIWCIFKNGATPGGLTWQWAQNTSDATGTTVQKGSYARIQRLTA